MHFLLRLRFIFLLIAFVNPANATLPKKVKKFLDNQKKTFVDISLQMNAEQHKLLFERYIDLLIASPIFKAGKIDKIDKSDLQAYFAEYYPFKEPGPKKEDLDFINSLRYGTDELLRLMQSKNGRVHKNIIHLNFVCNGINYEMPFKIQPNPEGIDLVLSGIAIPKARDEFAFETRCLEVSLVSYSKETNVSWIGTQDIACLIPQERAGDCLLKVAEEISLAFGRDLVGLQDESEVICTENKAPLNLTRLKIYQEGQGWYHKRGYVPVRDKKAYETQLDAFKQYKLATLVDEIEKYKPRRDEANILEKFKQKTTQFIQNNENSSVRDFMTWLWKTDCPNYAKLDEFFFERHREFVFVKSYPRPGWLQKKVIP